MTSTKTIALAIALAAAPIGALNAAESLTMKPHHGVSFDVGSERAVSYFLAEDGACKLVLTLAGEPDWDNPRTFAPTRFEARIVAERTIRYSATQGKALEFSCGAGAQTMSVTGIEQIAANAH